LVPVHGSRVERMIAMLISWILKTFLANAPKRRGCILGTVVFRGKAQVFPGVLFPNFRKILENSFRARLVSRVPTPARAPSLHQCLRSAQFGFRSAQSAFHSAHSAFRSADCDNRSAQRASSLSPQHDSLSQNAHSLLPQAPISLDSDAICSRFGGESLLKQ